MRWLDKIIRASDLRIPNIGGRLMALLFGGMFFAVGAAAFYAMALLPIYNSLKASSWEQVNGVVLESKVEWDDDSGKVVIRYSYRYQGNDYQGDQYQFGDTATNIGTQLMEEFVENHPEGAEIDVWINPNNPMASVVDRSITMSSWIGIPFCIPFLTVGIGGLGYAFFSGAIFRRKKVLLQNAAKQIRKKGAGELAELLENSAEWEYEDEKFHFTNGQGWVSFLGLLALFLFVGGIVSVFIIGMITLFISGDFMAWFLFFFLIPFEVIAVVILLGCWKELKNAKAPDYLVYTRKDDHSGVLEVEWIYLGMARELHGLRELAWYLKEAKANKTFNKWFAGVQGKLNIRLNGDVLLHEVAREAKEKGTVELPYSKFADEGLDLVMLWSGQGKVERSVSMTIIPQPSDD